MPLNFRDGIHPIHNLERGEIMGHHSKKSSKVQPIPTPIDINSMGQLLNNVDINTMSNMLNSIDINQVMSMLSNAFVPPVPPAVDTVKDNEEIKNDSPLESPKAINISDIFQDLSKGMGSKQPAVNPVLSPNDPVVIVLSSLKPFLAPDKSTIIDDMIKLLGIKAVVDSIFPPGQAISSTLEKSPIKDSPSLEIDETLN